MARLVEEIMNRELFSTRPSERIGDLIGYFAALDIGASPVLAEDGSLLGMISLRDLLNADVNDLVEDRMTVPVVSVAPHAPIAEAARLVAEAGVHRLPVVDEDNRVFGIVSSLDIVRGLSGMPATHPPAFPHYDKRTGVTWTDDTPLELDRVEAAPDGPGVIAIVHGGAGVKERVVWAESTANARRRLIDILATPQDDHPGLRYWLEQQPLRFRAASLPDPSRRARVVDQLQREAGYSRI